MSHTNLPEGHMRGKIRFGRAGSWKKDDLSGEFEAEINLAMKPTPPPPPPDPSPVVFETDPETGAVLISLDSGATFRKVLTEPWPPAEEPPPPPPVWQPADLPEMLLKAWYQETVPEGEVAAWNSSGVKSASAAQATQASRPTRLPANGGVRFAKGASHSLTWAVDTDTPYSTRWGLVIARGDLSNNPAVTAGVVASINGIASGSNFGRQPVVYFNATNNTVVVQSYHASGASFSLSAPCSPLLADWNIILWYRRGWSIGCSVNGVRATPIEFKGWAPNNVSAVSFMGLQNSAGAPIAGPMDVAIDALLLGQGELTDGMIDILEGWAAWRVGRQDVLPANHPYKAAAPAPGAATPQVPARYAFSQSAWDTWAAIDNATKFAQRGQPAPAIAGYATVFFDDFLTNTVVDDQAGGAGSLWFAPTWLTTVGVNAQAQRPAATPSSYVHDGASALALRLLYNSGWRTGAFASVNNNGAGRWWGKGIFEIRCKFPALPALNRPGFFPAFWAYGREHLVWRTRNRLEQDFFEYDGLDGSWINSTVHVHAGSIPFTSPEIRATDTSDKVCGYPVNPTTGFPATIDIYDGEYHEWYWQIEDDFTYVVLDGREVARVPTTPELRAPKYLLVDWAYDTNKGAVAVQGETYDMTIDWIRVRQKETDLALVPVGFSARPSIAGTLTVGQPLTATPNTTAGTLEYRWYRDGVPLPAALASTYVLQAEDAGHTLRVHVRALSLVNQPEAWSASTGVVS